MSIKNNFDISAMGLSCLMCRFAPLPLFPRRKHLSNILIPQKRQGCVRGASDQMPFYVFVIACFYECIFSRQTRQTNFQHYTHARTRARAVFFILTLYFEFVRKQSDQADASSNSADVGLTEWPFWSDAGLTQADAAGLNQNNITEQFSHKWRRVLPGCLLYTGHAEPRYSRDF